jgi:hypothetical protein
VHRTILRLVRALLYDRPMLMEQARVEDVAMLERLVGEPLLGRWAFQRARGARRCCLSHLLVTPTGEPITPGAASQGVSGCAAPLLELQTQPRCQPWALSRIGCRM